MKASDRQRKTLRRAAASEPAVPRQLDRQQIRQLRGLAHALRPVVRLGALGLTTGVRRELDIALLKHELVKVKLAGDSRAARDAQLATLCDDAGASVIQHIGSTAVLFRRNRKQPVIHFG